MKKTLKILVVVCSMLLLAGAFSSCAKKFQPTAHIQNFVMLLKAHSNIKRITFRK